MDIYAFKTYIFVKALLQANHISWEWQVFTANKNNKNKECLQKQPLYKKKKGREFADCII